MRKKKQLNSNVQWLSFSQSMSFSRSDQRESSLPSHPERSAVAAAEVQQRAVLLLLLVAGQPAAAGHLRGSPAQQAEALPDHAAAVWQRHLPRDRGQRPQPRPGPGGRFSSAASGASFFFSEPTTKVTRQTLPPTLLSSRRTRPSPLRSSTRGCRRPPTSPCGLLSFPSSR